MSKTETKLESKGAKAARGVIESFKAARRCGTPLLGIQTPDQFATISRIVEQVNGKTPFVAWDCVRGFRPLNPAAKDKMNCWKGLPEPPGSMSFNLASEVAEKMPEGFTLFVLNSQRHLDDPAAIQAVCNLRDTYKSSKRTIVLMAPVSSLPIELQTDVITFDEPLPDAAELEGIVKSLSNAAGVAISPGVVYRAVEAVQGLPAFAAEQVTAMSLSPEGLDIDALWERKRQQIEQTPSLAVSREGIKFDDLGGLTVIKDYLRDLLNGNGRPNAIVFIDEIEKLLAGQGDTSGVSQDQLGQLLSYMQDNSAMGVLLVGHPGSGKSAIAKATGNEAGVPTIKLDLGAAKGSLVGQSEQQLRTALKVITSVSNGSSLWIATCNNLASLPPELRRRFKCGTFFFDLSTKEERDAIWKVHRAKYGVKAGDAQPDDEGWTGAEIEQCCELAYRLNKPLLHAANYVVPISLSASDRVESLRAQADGKWLSASHLGVYRKEQDAQPVATVGRRINFND